MRVESTRPVTAGGWIHAIELPPAKKAKSAKKLTTAEVSRLVKRYFECRNAERQRRELAERLGLSHAALVRLHVGAGYDSYRKEWFTSWPERDHTGAFVGLVRRYSDGAKKTYPGTSHGLIYADDWRGDGKVLFLPEGGSDTAALLSLGVSAIGRPSNLGGVDVLRKLLRSYHGAVVVLGERDERDSPACGNCGACGLCWPGFFGARETARKLVRVRKSVFYCVLPGAKDVREWITKRPGAERDFLPVVRQFARKV